MKKLKKSETLVRAHGPVLHERDYPELVVMRNGRLVDIRTGKTPVFTNAEQWEGQVMTCMARSDAMKMHRLARLGCELRNAMKELLDS